MTTTSYTISQPKPTAAELEQHPERWSLLSVAGGYATYTDQYGRVLRLPATAIGNRRA